MSDRVTIYRQEPKDSNGGQTQKSWTFVVMDTPRALTVYLESYSEEYRGFRKRKWVAQRAYHRIAVNRWSGPSIIPEEPEVPEDVLGQAMAQLRARLTFKKWTR